MLKYLSKNRIKGNGGQAAPFFIILLVLIVIMAMVTINLGKVGFIKTETANSVDSGALAAGSVMANLFNAIGKASERMETSYRDFFDEISILFITALEHTISAIIEGSKARVEAQQAKDLACSNPCSAAAHLNNALSNLSTAMCETDALATTMNEIKDTLIKFHDKHNDYYKQVRALAESSRQKALLFAKKFGFMNSGIADKTADRQAFENFLSSPAETFEWFDGQERRHYVEVKANIQPVDTFELKVTEYLFSKEKEIIQAIIDLVTSAKGHFMLAQTYYNAGLGWLNAACLLAQIPAPFATECANAQEQIGFGLSENDIAITNLKDIIPKLIDAWKGLFPKDAVFTSHSDSDAEDQIICWIEEVIHDHLVKVTSKQEHQGRDETGIWNARYPDIESYSLVNFEGKGQIHKEKNGSGYQGPVLRFNASIIATDK
ncbi:MAG: pilus assembly protein TadG-related protein [Candidatus Omnitrophica bacterium]|nr:pilus assembly protein TadG-related protein [Candidatus Omnitrophota bacterium]